MNVEQLQFNSNDDFNKIKSHILENKEKFKSKSLSDNLIIKGIGDKYIKIENNFYSWNEIEKSLDEYKQGKNINEIILSILSWFYMDIETGNIYTSRKFNLDENFQKIKHEILNHKQHYKTGIISGIGENNIKITTFQKKDYYIGWDEIEKILEEIRYSSFEDLEEKCFTTIIIKQLFNDNQKQYTTEELELMNEENGKFKLKYYRLCKHAKLSYKVLTEEIADKKILRQMLILSLKWNNGQLPLSIDEEGIDHVILSSSTLVRADLRKNEHYTKRLKDELNLDVKVYATQYSDEYIYHVHNYKNLIKFEKDCSKWNITYSNKNLYQNAFRKEITNQWVCEIITAKSTEVCTIYDYENENNEFNPDLFIKLYQNFNRK